MLCYGSRKFRIAGDHNEVRRHPKIFDLDQLFAATFFFQVVRNYKLNLQDAAYRVMSTETAKKIGN